MAPVQALRDEDSLGDLLHQAQQQQAYDNMLQPFDPEDFMDADPGIIEIEENVAAEQPAQQE
eukprot:10973350-Alexandrium_andersonii.AAC.1